MTTRQEQAIRAHGDILRAIFPKVSTMDSVQLCKKLRRLEVATNRAACEACNTNAGAQAWPRISAATLRKLDNLLGFSAAGVPVFINGDPRGYSLKVDDAWVRANRDGVAARLHRDWGGYGILAPEIIAHGEG